MSAPPAQVEKTLQPPSHAEANRRAEKGADRFTSRAGGDTSSAQRVADERHSKCPDPDPEFHGQRPGEKPIAPKVICDRPSYSNTCLVRCRAIRRCERDPRCAKSDAALSTRNYSKTRGLSTSFGCRLTSLKMTDLGDARMEPRYSPGFTDFAPTGRMARFTAGAAALFPYARFPTMPFPSCTVIV